MGELSRVLMWGLRLTSMLSVGEIDRIESKKRETAMRRFM